MIIIELIINNEITSNPKNNIALEKSEKEIWSNINSSIGSNEEVLKNYYSNYSYVSYKFCDAMFKMEEELFKNSKDGLYGILKNPGDYENRSVMPVINKNLVDKFYIAKNMSDVNNNKTINNCKQEIIRQYNKEIDQYAKIYKIDSEQIKNIKTNLPKLVDKYFDATADRVLSNTSRDRLENYCDKVEKAYKTGNFKKMMQITDKILKFLSKETTIYRDENLFKRLRKDITKSKMVQNNLTEGKQAKLNSIEEELLNRFDDMQMYIIQSNLKVDKNLSQDDISIARFQMVTELFKKML